MPRLKPTPEAIEEGVRPVVELVERHLRLGGRPPGRIGWGRSAIQAAAEEAVRLGWSKAKSPTDGHKFIQGRLNMAKTIGLEPDWTLYRPAVYQPSTPLFDASEDSGVEKCIPKIAHEKSQWKAESLSFERAIRVCVIPDVHVDPRLSNERLKWIGRWVAHSEPDAVIQLGDFATLDSLSTHHDRGSLTARLTPNFAQDVDAVRDAIGLYKEGMQGFSPKIHIMTEGNHEYRAKRYEELNPHLGGSVTINLVNAIAEGGFRIAPYGEFVFIGGVGFIHHAVNGAGRAYGGKTAPQRIAADSNFSVVCGHYHHRYSADVPKIGPNQHTKCISAGCALPFGYIEPYAKHSTTGWWHGVLMITIMDGVILDEHWTSMLTLEKMFGD